MANVVVHATVIPLLLIAIDHHWPADNNEWPDWTVICTADSTTLSLHPWWPRVERKGVKTKQGESSASVLGKRKATEEAEAEPRRNKDLGKAQVEEEAEAEGAGKAVGQMKTSDDAKEDMVIEDEEEAARRKEKVAGKMKAAGDSVGDDIERGRPRQRRRLQGKDTQTIAPHRSRGVIRVPRDTPTPPYSPPPKSVPQVGLDAEDRGTFPSPCSECKKKNLTCDRAATGTACAPCQASKRRCDHSGPARGRSVSRARSRARSRASEPSKGKSRQSSPARPKAPSPSQGRRRSRRQSRPPSSKTQNRKSFLQKKLHY